MLSKEEIKCIKQDLELIRDTKSSGTYTSYKIDQAIEYIDQLETREQKLIDKLEEDINKANEILNDTEYRYIQEVIDEQWERKRYAQEILSIVKK